MSEPRLESLIFQTLKGEKQLSVCIHEASVWLTIEQISKLFSVSSEEVLKSIEIVYEDKELQGDELSKFFSLPNYKNFYDSRERQKYYNLDAILVIGYQLDIGTTTRFRQWVDRYLEIPQAEQSFLAIFKVYYIQIIGNFVFTVGTAISMIFFTDISNKLAVGITTVTFLMVLYNIIFDAIRYEKTNGYKRLRAEKL